MRDILESMRTWWDAGLPIALATVVDVQKSAPRQVGAVMAVNPDGEVVGSVSGGCVENAVYEVAQQVLASGEPTKARYGVSDERAFAVGLTCGGSIEVFVEPIDAERVPFFDEVLASITAGTPVAVATVVEGRAPLAKKLAVWPERTSGTLGLEGLSATVAEDVRAMLEQGQSGLRRYGPNGERRQDDVAIFISSFTSPPQMLIFGANDFAAAVARLGKFLGYRVTVCDARQAFVTRRRFLAADQVAVEWPHRFLRRAAVDPRTAICILTHDPKFDIPLLEVALRSEAGYVGAMGSRRTHEQRLARLRKLGLTDQELSRLRSPIGLDIGARTPEETAVSIGAEIVQLCWGRSGLPLTATTGRIHGRRSPTTARQGESVLSQ